MDNRLRRMGEAKGWNSDGGEDSSLNLYFNHHWHSDMPVYVVSGHKFSIIVLEKRSLLEKRIILKEEKVGRLRLDQ